MPFDLRALQRLAAQRDFIALESALSAAPLDCLAAAWGELQLLEKLVFFKLLDAGRAMDFFGRLPFREKYHLLCGFPPQAVAPVLEGLDPAQRRAFVQLPREFYDRMFRQLVAQGTALSVAVHPN